MASHLPAALLATYSAADRAWGWLLALLVALVVLGAAGLVTMFLARRGGQRRR